MTNLSSSLDNKNSSHVNAAPEKAGAMVEIDPLPAPEFEINATNGLCIEEPPVVLEANIEPLQLSNPILSSETLDSMIVNESEVVIAGVVSMEEHNKETVMIVDEKCPTASSSVDDERKIDCSNNVCAKFPPLWGLVSICGRRIAMEDSATAMPRFTKIPSHMLFDADDNIPHFIKFPNQELTAHLFGVYDGHGGRQVANFCIERLHEVLAEQIKENHTNRRVDSNVQHSKEDRWREIFTNCFRKLDDEVGGFPQVDGVPIKQPICSDSVGSTAVVAVVCSTHVIVGNCGDSRAVICRGKEPIPLSVDHKPEREDECARIEALGGRVISWYGNRIFGVLAVSRSIGDRYMKPYVISDPEVTMVPRAKEDECLILASDGLWDVITNKEACDIARRRLMLWHKKNQVSEDGGEQRGDKIDEAAQDASEYLSRLALQRGSEDNISVIVVDLKAKRKLKKKTTSNKT